MQQGAEGHRRIAPLRLLTVLLFVILFALMPVLYVNLLASVLEDLGNKEWGGADFTAYYTAARLIREKKSPYDGPAFWQEAESLGFRHDRPYIYFPLLAIVLTPLTLLTPQHATVVWFCTNAALLTLSAVLMITVLRLHESALAVAGLMLATLVFYPAIFSIFVGQANVWLLTLLVLAWYLAKRGTDVVAGIMIAFASLIKVFPFCIALYFLWKGKYRIFLSTLAAVIVLVGISVAIVGLDPHITYVKSVLPTQFLKPHPLNQSLWAFVARILPVDHQNALPLRRLVGLSASALLALITVLLIPRDGKAWEALDLEISLVVVTMLLVSTVSWVGTLTLMIIAYAAATRYLLDGCRRNVRLLAIATLLSYLAVNSQRVVEIYMALPNAPSLPSAWLLSMPMYGMIVLWFTIAYMLLTRREAIVLPDTDTGR